MKKLFLLFLLLQTAGAIMFAQTVALDSIARYEGQTVTVCAKVQSAYVTKGEKKTTYLNFGKPYPNNTFTVVIFEKDLPNFSYAPAEHLKDKEVCITGKVIMYKGKPEIIAREEKQIQ